MTVTVVGAGLAGCEAAWQMAKRGVDVRLVEQKPLRRSPAHHADTFAELVCSNSLRAAPITTGPGLLKAEMRLLDSLIIACADATRVEAGGALAVDREAFSRLITQRIRSCRRITVAHEECTRIPEGPCIIASGPLTDGALAEEIAKRTGEPMNFYDASAPLVTYDSIDRDLAFFAARYGKGTPDYVNCPMTEAEYTAFWEALSAAETAPVHGFEESMVFEGCMPVEVMAHRGKMTLAFGPLKPVGLTDPRTGKMPYAVVQLRRDNADGTLYNMVGFQTHLKYPEQKRVFSMIPALHAAEFARYGVMHRNSFLRSPGLLDAGYALIADRRIRFAGQMTGVEGYIESAASGLAAGICTAFALAGRPEPDFTRRTAVGALAHYVAEGPETGDFQPMNINFGIFEPLENRRRKRDRKAAMAQRALDTMTALLRELT